MRLCTTLVLAALSALAAAQRSPLGTTSRLMVAMMPEVKKELKVTKAQDKMVQEALKAKQEEMQTGGLAGFDLSDPMGSMDIDFSPIFEPAQLARLEELFVQCNGGFAIADAKVAAALGLSDEQREKAKSAKSEANKELVQKMSQARSASAMKEAQKRRDELAAGMLEILTTDQKAKFEALKGKAFKFKT